MRQSSLGDFCYLLVRPEHGRSVIDTSSTANAFRCSRMTQRRCYATPCSVELVKSDLPFVPSLGIEGRELGCSLRGSDGCDLTRKAEISARLPLVLGYGADEAAASMGFSKNFFLSLVERGLMPQPRIVPGTERQVWDVDELRAAFKALPHAGEGERAAGADTWADFQ